MSSLPSMRQIGERMDPVHPVTRFGGYPTLGTDDYSWYLVNAETDAGKLYSTMRFSQRAGLYHEEDKELGSIHRLRPVDMSRQGNNPRFTRSLRQIAERHSRSTPVRFLFYNTWLINPPFGIDEPPDRKARSRELSQTLKNADYDIIALCEMFEDENVDEVKQALPNYTCALGPEGGIIEQNSGLATYIRQGWQRRTKRQAFWAQGGPPDKFAEKGILYMEVDVGPGSIDLFTTHLHAKESGTRNYQVDQLAYFIHQNQKPENVTVVAGDFNIDGRSNEYERLLRKMALRKELRLSHGTSLISVRDYDALDLQDVWLSHGGPSGSTHKISNMEVVCKLDDTTGSDGPAYCDDEYVYDGDHTESDDIPGYRLDYVFVEKPKDSHQLNIDIARVRRRPFWRSPADPTTFQTGDRPHFLSDHIGLDLTLYASPV